MIGGITSVKRLFKDNYLRLVNFSFYLLATIVNTVLMLIINPFIAKNLSHSDYAIIGYHGAFQIILLPLVNFSLTSYYLRNYFLTPKDKLLELRDTINKMILYFGGFSLIICTIGFYIYFKVKNVQIPFFPFFLFSIITVYINNFITMKQIDFRLNKQAKKYFILTILLRITIIISTVFLVIVIPLGALGRMLATLVGTVVFGLFCYKTMNSGMKVNRTIIKSAFSFCWPLALASILWYFLSGVDILLLEKLNDIRNMALYNIAIGLTSKIAIFYAALAQTFEPDIYRAIASKKYIRMILIALSIILLNIIPNALLFIFAKPVVNILTYGRYIEASKFIRILIFKNISMSLYYTVILIIVGLGYTKSELLNRIIGAVLCYVMFDKMIKNYGYIGAAWGQTFSFLILTTIGILFILVQRKKMFEISEKNLYNKGKKDGFSITNSKR